LPGAFAKDNSELDAYRRADQPIDRPPVDGNFRTNLDLSLGGSNGKQ
jgi:hypothetical protein